MKKVIKYIVFPSVIALSINAYAENGVMNCPNKNWTCVVNKSSTCVLPGPNFSNWIAWNNLVPPSPPSPGTNISLRPSLVMAFNTGGSCSYLAYGPAGGGEWTFGPPNNFAIVPVLTGKNDWHKRPDTSYYCDATGTCPFVLKSF